MEGESRRYFHPPGAEAARPTADDLHAWSIYRQNINSELSTSALGNKSKISALPYGNFALRPHQVDAILHRAKGTTPSATASSELLNSTNAMTYLKFGLPRISMMNLKSTGPSTPDTELTSKGKIYGSRGANLEKVSAFERNSRLRKSRSEMDVRGARQRRQYSIHNGQNGIYDEGNHVRSPSEGDVNRVDRFRQIHRVPTGYEIPYNVAYTVSPERRRDPKRYASIQDVGESHNPNQVVPEQESVTENRFNNQEKQLKDGINIHSSSYESEQRITNGFLAATGMLEYSSTTVPTDVQNNYLHPIPPMLNERFFSAEKIAIPSTNKSHSRKSYIVSAGPRLQVRSLSLTETEIRKSAYSFSAVTFEAKGGEVVGILATSNREGNDILEALIDRRGKWGTSLKGAITYNGLNVIPEQLARCAVYAGTNLDFNPNMSLKQTILFTSHLAQPGEPNRKTDTRGRIEAIIADLGLSNVAGTRVGELTQSEKQRLNIACQLLADPDLVLLDQPTQNMDIFDTFFLVEYLRQWALRGRIVIVTLQPPTFEIFNMLSRVLILSNGRTLYSGKRKHMIAYFESMDYLCPTQKNPADYYVDLVSVDQTTEEANVESLQRIEYLSSVFTQRQPILSDLSQPGELPPKIWKAGFLWQVIVLWIRALIFMFPYNLIEAMHQIMQSVAMSVMLGVIFFGLPRNQAAVDDRTGLFFVVLSIGIWPMIIHIINKEYCNKVWLHKETQDKLYHKGAYFFAKVMYAVPVTGVSIGAYLIPVYFMSRLRQDDDFRPFGLYACIMYLHTLAWRAIAKLAVFVFPTPGAMAFPLAIIIVISFLTSGYSIHPTQISEVFNWSRWISPTHYAFHQLNHLEFHGIEKIDCQKIPVQVGGLPILTSPSCGLESGRDAISFLWLSSHFSYPLEFWQPFLAVGLFDILVFLLCFLAFMVIDQRAVRHNKNG